MRAHHQQRHTLLASILRGEHNSRELAVKEGEEEQLISTDFTQRAVRTGEQILVYDVGSAGLPQRWPLPQVPEAWAGCDTWAWWRQHLMLPYGSVFTLEGAADEGECAESGLVFLDTLTGTTSLVRLPDQDGFVDQYVRLLACPSAGLVLVEHFDAQLELVFSVFQGSGAKVTCTICPSEELSWVSWAQGGQAVAFCDMHSVWAWELSGAGPVLMQTLTTRPEAAWAVPYTGDLVVRQLSSRRRSGAVVLTSLASSQTGSQAPPAEVTSRSDITGVALGARLAVLTSVGESEDSTLRLLDVQREPFAVLTLRPQAFWPFTDTALELSADGELCAAVCGVIMSDSEGEDDSHEPHLAIIHLASGRQHHFPLSSSLGQHRTLRWTRDCTAVVVLDDHGHSQLFDFACRPARSQKRTR